MLVHLEEIFSKTTDLKVFGIACDSLICLIRNKEVNDLSQALVDLAKKVKIQSTKFDLEHIKVKPNLQIFVVSYCDQMHARILFISISTTF